MIILVELCLFSATDRFSVRQKMNAFSSDGPSAWAEWSQECAPLSRKPDVSLVWTDGLSLNAVIAATNSASCGNVILIGTSSPQIGLPRLEAAFGFDEVSHWLERRQGAASAKTGEEPLPQPVTSLSHFNHGYLDTLPPKAWIPEPKRPVSPNRFKHEYLDTMPMLPVK